MAQRTVRRVTRRRPRSPLVGLRLRAHPYAPTNPKRYKPADPNNKDFVCPICQDILDDPVSICAEGHSFCRECINSVGLVMECPVCKGKVLPQQRQVLVRQQIQKLKFHCAQHPFCKTVVPLEGMAKHLRTCEHRPVPCPFEACDRRVAFHELEAHKASCKHKPPTCDLCDATLTNKEHQKGHQNWVCPKSEVQCPDCNRTYPGEAMCLHRATCGIIKTFCVFCMKRDVPKVIKKHRCSVRVPVETVCWNLPHLSEDADKLELDPEFRSEIFTNLFHAFTLRLTLREHHDVKGVYMLTGMCTTMGNGTLIRRLRMFVQGRGGLKDYTTYIDTSRMTEIEGYFQDNFWITGKELLKALMAPVQPWFQITVVLEEW